MTPGLRRWGVFNLVGLGGFLLQIGAIALLTRACGWPAIAATAVALEIAALHNFACHSRWTWRERRAQSARCWLARYGRYQIAKMGSLAVSLALTVAIGMVGVGLEIANTAAVLLCAIPNYLVSEHYVFHRST